MIGGVNLLGKRSSVLLLGRFLTNLLLAVELWERWGTAVCIPRFHCQIFAWQFSFPQYLFKRQSVVVVDRTNS